MEEHGFYHDHGDGVKHYHAAPSGKAVERPHTHTQQHTHDAAQDHDHAHAHAHGHTHTQTRNVINRLSRAIGHLESVKRMVEDGRDCSEVLVQLAAVRAALASTGKVIIKDHIEHCVVDAVELNDSSSIEELILAIDKFI